ncbi:Protein of unknown function DUF58 [Tessaracoccus bendigoensis DSM 12906]|uniref:DUF58 domain-containing protein n=1 Tax=Tessaracoccus bendigoensis DSM 12906 TaxID=1123357 RepID=A0A1M6FGC7_9ACTN|nr:DUF58 domain-containing protein [Tessaracoccus bendigoensis]SHI96683.1 Protein of unknown function DUF58 [Tessaracoccus bendigoensis DSM 12906]
MTARVRRIRQAVALAVRHKVAGRLDGVHASLHVGRSLDFFDLREYVQGDDVADIDWRASARSTTMLVKRQVAERHLVLLLVVATGLDLAGLAPGGARKLDVALDAAATLGVLASSFGDYTGTLWWQDGAVASGRPTTRLVELERQLGLIEGVVSPAAGPTDLDRLLATAATALRRRGLVAVIADDVDIDPQSVARIRRLAAQHQVIWITVPDIDPTVEGLEGPLLDLATGSHLPGWLDDAELHAQLAAETRSRSEARAEALNRLGVIHTELNDPGSVTADVLSVARRLRHAG